ncbi:unnamed protein product [Adineta steineri]|uniref:Uncharacterized protein n=1 Tax=Adineta steineri TaxID=433720 RepID=A0A815JP97_9BILA|nr:unnamed protein product [Adineta steineri]CAF1380539.1 unnamed protein product [Adineta steineri]CAF1607436.1 unnamed protein product [Adineta steineri]
MANKKRTNSLKTSLKTLRQINGFDGTDKLPVNVNRKLLDQCSDIIQEFIDNDKSFPTKTIKSKSKPQKRQVSKIKKSKNKVTKNKSSKPNKSPRKIKAKRNISKKNIQSLNSTNMISNNGYPCYPTTFPCFRSCGPINCPKNKLPMPRDLWYRIIYSQIIEQQLGNEQSIISKNRSVTHLHSSSKRKHKEENKSNTKNSFQQQTMNATSSSISTKIIKLDVNNIEYISETLPLDVEYKHNQSGVIDSKVDFKDNHETNLSTQSAHAELINRSKIRRGVSADATFELSSLQPKQSVNDIPNDKSTTVSSTVSEHPLFNQLVEYYNLHDISRLELLKRLDRRLIHIRQTLEKMSSNDIEIKLKYKRDALVKKRQTPVQSLTKDERIAMAELELNVYEYVKILDEPSLKCFHSNSINEYEIEQLAVDSVLPVGKSVITFERSASTFNTVHPPAISQSAALLSISTQFSEQIEKSTSWNHPLLPTLMNMFEHLTPWRKVQIHKQLARRYEHICKKTKQFNKTQLNAPLEQAENIPQPTDDDLLRAAELKLSLFELEQEQIQRN